MTDLEWARGMAELRKAGLPGWPEDPAESATRAELYRRHLDDLSGPAWLVAVQEAIRTERWFPTVAALREYAAAWAPPLPALPTGRRTDEQRDVDRETARHGLELVKTAFAERMAQLPPAPIVSPVPESTNVVAGEERMELLRAQAGHLQRAGDQQGEEDDERPPPRDPT